MTFQSPSQTTSKRRLCEQCHKPVVACLCGFVTSIKNDIELVILQHDAEATHAKNTAILLQLSLSRCHTMVSSREERFDESALEDVLYREGRTPILLYPPYDANDADICAPAPLPDLSTMGAHQLRLVVIDATWRKSRKLLYLHPELQALPRWSLTESYPSIYKIRKADSENQLSTLEASCYALGQLEEMPSRYYPLLQAMTQFVEQRLAFSRQSTPR